MADKSIKDIDYDILKKHLDEAYGEKLRCEAAIRLHVLINGKDPRKLLAYVDQMIRLIETEIKRRDDLAEKLLKEIEEKKKGKVCGETR